MLMVIAARSIGTKLFSTATDTDHIPDEAVQENSVSVLVAGSLAIDFSCNYSPLAASAGTIATKTSNPAVITQSLGGVGQNIATAAHYAGANVWLCSAVAEDVAGSTAIASLQQRGMNTHGVRLISSGLSTAQYVAINDEHRNLFLAMADIRILEETLDTFEQEWKPMMEEMKPAWLVIDANWNKDTVRKWVDSAMSCGARVAFEPVSVQKSTRIFFKTWHDHMQSLLHGKDSTASINSRWSANQVADLTTPNEMELLAMSEHVLAIDAWTSFLASLKNSLLMERIHSLSCGSVSEIDDRISIAALKLLSSIPCILTKLGPKGVLLTEVLHQSDARLHESDEAEHILFRNCRSTFKRDRAIMLPESKPDSSLFNIGGIYMRLFPAAEAVPADHVVSVNGVGDTFLGVLVAAMARSPKRPVSHVINIAQRAALLTLKSAESVSPKVRGLLDDEK